MGQAQLAGDVPNDPDELGKRAQSYRWDARRNMFMALITAAAWVAVTATIVWLPHQRSEADLEGRITNLTAEIQTGYEELLRSVEPHLKALGLSSLAGEKITSLKNLTPVQISGYDLGTQLYPAVLPKLSCESACKWLPVLGEIQPSVKPLENKKAELANYIGEKTTSTVTVSAWMIVVSLLAFAIFGRFASIFATQALRYAALAIQCRALADADLLFAGDERYVTALRETHVKWIVRLQNQKVTIIPDALKLIKETREFINSLRP